MKYELNLAYELKIVVIDVIPDCSDEGFEEICAYVPMPIKSNTLVWTDKYTKKSYSMEF